MWPVSLVGILSTAVVCGADMFFLTIGRPALQIKRKGRHNWLSRLGVCRTRPQQSVWIGKWALGIQRSLACLMRGGVL